METQIAGSIARMDGSTSQDAIFKDVLAYKEVLGPHYENLRAGIQGLHHSPDHRLY